MTIENSRPIEKLPDDLDFIIATQAFLEAYRLGATVPECEEAMRVAGYRIVKIEEQGRE